MKIVFTNGVFDIIHRGHIELLEFCKKQGDYLVVALDSDLRVKMNKGKERPINSQNDRKFVLESIKYVDRVVSFDSDEQLETLIKTMRPAIMVIGEEYKDKKIIGKEYVGEIVFFPKMEGFSSTNIINQLYDTKTN